MSIDYDLLIGQPRVGDPQQVAERLSATLGVPALEGRFSAGGRWAGVRLHGDSPGDARAIEVAEESFGLRPAISVRLRNQCDGSDEEWMATQAQLASTAVLLAVDLDAEAVRRQNYEIVVMRRRAGRIELDRGWKYWVDDGFADFGPARPGGTGPGVLGSRRPHRYTTEPGAVAAACATSCGRGPRP
jgi:hypothetical protein